MKPNQDMIQGPEHQEALRKAYQAALIKVQQEKVLKDKEDAEQLQAEIKVQQEKDLKDKEDAEQLQAEIKLQQEKYWKDKEVAEQLQAQLKLQQESRQHAQVAGSAEIVPPANMATTQQVLQMSEQHVGHGPHTSIGGSAGCGGAGDDNNAAPRKKRKLTSRQMKKKGATTSAEGSSNSVNDGEKNDNNNSDDDNWDEDEIKQSANTARRILWQRGHAATVPSKVRELIEKATVRRVEDALEPLKTMGFAILEDMTEAFHPKNRCTKEQRDYIEKCNPPPPAPHAPRLQCTRVIVDTVRCKRGHSSERETLRQPFGAIPRPPRPPNGWRRVSRSEQGRVYNERFQRTV